MRLLLSLAAASALAGCTAPDGATGRSPLAGFGFALPVDATAPTAASAPTVPVTPAGGAPTTPASTPAPSHSGHGGGGSSGGGGASPSTAPTEPPEPMQVTTYAGAAEAGFADGPADTARFRFPQGIARASDGTLYVADSGNHCIRKVAPDGTVSTVAGSGEAGFADGPAATAQFDGPTGVALGVDGMLWVADGWNHCIRRIAADGTVSTPIGTGRTAGTADGAGAAAQFDRPTAIAAGPDGSLYVSDEFAQTVRKITFAGASPTVTTLAGDGYSKGHKDATGGDARFTFPSGLAVAPDGTVYVLEQDACYMRRITPAGVVTTLNGDANYRCGFSDGAIATARVNNATGLTVGPDGALYIADTFNGSVRRVSFDQPGNEVATFAGEDPGYRNGSLAHARFESPLAIVAGADGEFFVTDAHSIRRIKP